MKLKFATLIAVVVTFTFGIVAQTAKTTEQPGKSASDKLPPASQVLNAYVKAIGGREAREKIKSLAMKGTVEMAPMGLKGTFESTSAAPNLNYVRTDIAGFGEILDGFDGTTAWTINPLQGSRDKTPAEVAQAKIINDFYRDINLDKVYKTLTVTSFEKVGPSDAYVVKAEAAALATPTMMYFDTKTGLLVRMDSTIITPEGNQAIKSFLDDYRNVEGILIPFKVRTVLSAFEMIMAVTEVKANVPVKPELFAKPAK